MKLLLTVFVGLLCFNAIAETKILLFDDLESSQADFKFYKQKDNGVSVVAEYMTNFCDDEGGGCLQRLATKTLPFFMREKRAVFYVNNDEKIYCGEAMNLVSRGDMLHQDCRFEIHQEKVCTEYFTENDCIKMEKKYRGYLIINN